MIEAINEFRNHPISDQNEDGFYCKSNEIQTSFISIIRRIYVPAVEEQIELEEELNQPNQNRINIGYVDFEPMWDVDYIPKPIVDSSHSFQNDQLDDEMSIHFDSKHQIDLKLNSPIIDLLDHLQKFIFNQNDLVITKLFLSLLLEMHSGNLEDEIQRQVSSLRSFYQDSNYLKTIQEEYENFYTKFIEIVALLYQENRKQYGYDLALEQTCNDAKKMLNSLYLNRSVYDEVCNRLNVFIENELIR